jgi:hypothetical protein
MHTNVEQEQIERRVFEEFVCHANIQALAIENRRDPEPDIHCILSDGGAYFELMRIADEDAEATLATGPSSGFVCFDLWAAVPKKVGKKIAKAAAGKYAISGDLLHLLLYYDTDSTRDPVEEFVRRIPRLDAALAQTPFSRIWIFERSYGIVGVIHARPFRVFKDANYPQRGFRAWALTSARTRWQGKRRAQGEAWENRLK